MCKRERAREREREGEREHARELARGGGGERESPDTLLKWPSPS